MVDYLTAATAARPPVVAHADAVAVAVAVVGGHRHVQPQPFGSALANSTALRVIAPRGE